MNSYSQNVTQDKADFGHDCIPVWESQSTDQPLEPGWIYAGHKKYSKKRVFDPRTGKRILTKSWTEMMKIIEEITEHDEAEGGWGDYKGMYGGITMTSTGYELRQGCTAFDSPTKHYNVGWACWIYVGRENKHLWHSPEICERQCGHKCHLTDQ
jgi:hypothetical protein